MCIHLLKFWLNHCNFDFFLLTHVNSHKAHKAFSISEAQSVLQYAEKKPFAKLSKKERTWTNRNKNTHGKNIIKCSICTFFLGHTLEARIDSQIFPQLWPFISYNLVISVGWNTFYKWGDFLVLITGISGHTLWWTNILPWKITIFHGKIHYFYGHFQLLS